MLFPIHSNFISLFVPLKIVVVQSFSLSSFPDFFHFIILFIFILFHFIFIFIFIFFYSAPLFPPPIFFNRAPTFFHRPPTSPLSARFWRKVFPPVSKQKYARSKQSPKSKEQSQEVALCHPRALRMPLCKECKKLFISSSPPIIISYFQFTPLPSLAKFPPLFSPQGWA